MVTQISKGIKITVTTNYREEFSAPDKNHFLFSYRISIENYCDYPVQLLRRHWYIFDSCFHYDEVEGEGVIGQQPVLQPGQVYEYESACNLMSDMGRMHGTYLMERVSDGYRFYVEIPEFELVHPARFN